MVEICKQNPNFQTKTIEEVSVSDLINYTLITLQQLCRDRHMLKQVRFPFFELFPKMWRASSGSCTDASYAMLGIIWEEGAPIKLNIGFVFLDLGTPDEVVFDPI